MIFKKTNKTRIILASQSPRRKMLLEGLDINFEVFVREGIDESYPPQLTMSEIPLYLAKKKASFYRDLLDEHTIVITADTIVWHKNKVLGKPVDSKDAIDIITQLSGDMHTVVTGVCISSLNKTKSFTSISNVYFRDLTDDEITYYVEKYKPMDKAGAYGIQEWIGYIGIENIEGSVYNVMGLPVQKLYKELLTFVE